MCVKFHLSGDKDWHLNWFLFDMQLEGRSERAQSEVGLDAKAAFNREREEHKKLLTESHQLVMDLQWQIQHNEKNWTREKVEVLERFDKDRREWERQKQELLRRLEEVRPVAGQGRRISVDKCNVTKEHCGVFKKRIPSTR